MKHCSPLLYENYNAQSGRFSKTQVQDVPNNRQQSALRYLEEHMNDHIKTKDGDIKPYPIGEVLEEADRQKLGEKRLFSTFNNTAEELSKNIGI